MRIAHAHTLVNMIKLDIHLKNQLKKVEQANNNVHRFDN